MSTEKTIAWFDLDGINKAPARFDFAKLGSINAHYMRAMDEDELFATFMDVLPHLAGGPDFGARLDETRRRRFREALPLLKDRAKTLVDLIDGAAFIMAERPLEIDNAAKGLLDEGARCLLSGLLPSLTALPDWTADSTEAAVKSFAMAQGVKLGAVAQPLRAALTGRAASPGIFEVLAVLGREESLARIGDRAT
jgi:glutamyl-tRNA synthetase